ncbi:MAG: hypothetical protein Q7V58_11490 [Actinomycetota bacterium]|nr:hypothetical protein [Actinomycetota bacterium]MDP1877329.1 hypothetical protein [Actinomycetota bacterium]
MTDDERTYLTKLEAARFNDIVGREWPTSQRDASSHLDRSTAPLPVTMSRGHERMTVFRPQRPSPMIAGTGLVMLAASLIATAHFGLPTVNDIVDQGLSASLRANAAQALAASAARAAFGIVASLAVCAAWMVWWARYRLRRSAWRTVLNGNVHPIERQVCPPNIATALSWAGILVAATILAGWWLPNQLDLLAKSRSTAVVNHLSEQLTWAGIVWCAITVACMAGLAVWACREGRHQIRVEANRDYSSV